MTNPVGTDLTLEDPAVLREHHQQMALIRAFELRAAEMYPRARIGGYCHLNLGEEATVTGLTAALREDDYLFAADRPLHRELMPAEVLHPALGHQLQVLAPR